MYALMSPDSVITMLSSLHHCRSFVEIDTLRGSSPFRELLAQSPINPGPFRRFDDRLSLCVLSLHEAFTQVFDHLQDMGSCDSQPHHI